MTGMAESPSSRVRWWSAGPSERRAFISSHLVDWPPLSGSQLDRLGAIFDAAQKRQAAEQTARADLDAWTEDPSGERQAG